MTGITTPICGPICGPVVGAVTERVATPPYALNGAYTAVIGDSIDQGATVGTSWWNETCRLSGQRMRQYVNAGVGGNTTTQMLARIQTDIIALNPRPDVCVIGGCTNDFGNDISAATTQQNYIDMVSALRTAGIRPAIRNCPSNNNAGTGQFNTIALRRQGVLDHNSWLQSYCASEGIHLFDVFAPTYDGSGLSTSLSDDGTHFNSAGCHVAALYVSQRLPDYFRTAAVPYLTALSVDANNLFVNGIFVGDTNADGLANNWSSTSISSPSIEANAFDDVGNWQNFATTTGTTGYINPSAQPTIIGGHVYEIAALVRGAAGKMIIFRAEARDASNVSLGIYYVVRSWTVQDAGEVQTGFLRLVAPSTAVRLLCTIQGFTDGATGQLSVARATIRDVT